MANDVKNAEHNSAAYVLSSVGEEEFDESILMKVMISQNKTKSILTDEDDTSNFTSDL